MKKRQLFKLAVFLLFFSPMFYRAKAAAAGMILGIRTAGATVIPALLPYFVVSNLLLKSNLSLPKRLRQIFQRLFRVSPEGLIPFCFSLIGGYPLGIKTVSALYSEKQLTKEDANTLLHFCNNTGPAFFLGVAGGKILGSAAAGFALYVIHIISAVLCGLLFRKRNYRVYSITREKHEAFSFAKQFPQAVLNASGAMLNISAFVILFSGYQAALFSVPIITQTISFAAQLFHLRKRMISCLVSGFLEMTSGLVCVQAIENRMIQFLLLSAIINWGGMCVHFQALSQLSSDISTKGYYVSKIIQSILAVSLAVPLGELIYIQRVSAFTMALPLAVFGFFALCKLLLQAEDFRLSKNKSEKSRKRGRNSETNLV